MNTTPIPLDTEDMAACAAFVAARFGRMTLEKRRHLYRQLAEVGLDEGIHADSALRDELAASGSPANEATVRISAEDAIRIKHALLRTAFTEPRKDQILAVADVLASFALIDRHWS